MIDAETQKDFERLKELLFRKDGNERGVSLSESDEEEVKVLRGKIQAYIRRSELPGDLLDPHIGIIEKPLPEDEVLVLTNGVGQMDTRHTFTFTCPDCNQVKPLGQMADITPICLSCFG